MSDLKTCTKCKVEKQKTEFSKDSSRKDLLNPHCKSCNSAYRAENAERISAYKRQWNIDNFERVSSSKRDYAIDNAEKIAAYKREWCKENKYRLLEKSRQWKLNNPEKVKAGARAYFAANKSAIAARNKARYDADPEKFAEMQRAHRLANPAAFAARCRNRRAMKRAAEGTHTAEDIKAIFESQRGLCATCNKKLFKSGAKTFHVDHIQPLSKGGSNDKYNLQCLCQKCNTSKGAKNPEDWAAQNGRLI